MSQPRQPYAWYVVGVLMLVYMIGFVDRQILALLVGPVKGSLALSDTEIGLLQGFAFVMLFAVMGVPAGWLADRYGKRLVLGIGLVLWCACTAACGLAGSFWSLFLLRVGVGAGEATISPCSLATIADWFPPEKRALATSIYVSSGSVGVGLAYTVGGQIVDTVSKLEITHVLGDLANDPWRVAFVLVGLAGLVALPFVLTLRAPRQTADARREAAAGQPPASAVRASADGSGAAFGAFLASRRRLLALHFLAFACFSSVSYGVLAWAPAYFMRGFGWSASTFGLVFGLVFATFSVTGTLLGGLWSQRLRRAGRVDANFFVMCAGMAGLVIPATLAPVTPDATLSIALYGTVAFFLSVPVGCSVAAVQDYAPAPVRARVIALYYVAVSLGGVGFGPLVVGLLTDLVFRSDGLVGRSLALAGAVLSSLALGFILAARREFVRSGADAPARAAAGTATA